MAEQTRLALAVAEEERDAARGAEERLTYELERVVEERTTAWTAMSGSRNNSTTRG